MSQRSRITIVHSDAGMGPGGPLPPPPIFGRSVTPISTEGIIYSPRGCPKIIFIRLNIKLGIVQMVTHLVFCLNDSPFRDHFGKRTA